MAHTYNDVDDLGSVHFEYFLVMYEFGFREELGSSMGLFIYFVCRPFAFCENAAGFTRR